ncbi:hypothetical protein TSMEX_011362 [Taenia solium]|eukprot:TsM_000293300 transcript=TsM_000293300 gene=TsM_000293300
MCGACGAAEVAGTYTHLRPIMCRLCATRGDVAAAAGTAVAAQSAVVPLSVGRSVGRSTWHGESRSNEVTVCGGSLGSCVDEECSQLCELV